MTTNQPSFLTDDDVARELATARRRVAELLAEVQEFSTLFHTRPWIALDELMAELRAAVTTLQVLERLQVIGS